MANLSTSKTFDNVYQLETTDHPIGGSGGIANSQAQSLANRDAWMLDFTNRLGGNSTPIFPTTDVTLSASDAGEIVFMSPSANAICTMPLLSASKFGDTYVIRNIASGNIKVTITGAGPDEILEGLSGAPTFFLGVLETVVLRYLQIGGSPVWCVIAHEGYEIKAGTIVLIPRVTGRLTGGYLLCDGALYGNSGFPRLFNVIGTTFGSGSGSFKVPLINSFVTNDTSATHVDYYIKF